MKRNLFRVRLSFALLTCIVAAAQPPAARVQIKVTPDHADWNYKPGEEVGFTVQAAKDGAPGLYNWGHNDETRAPTSTFAVFNTITAPKTLTVQIETGHNIVPEQRARVNRWLLEFLKTGKAPAGVQP